MPPTYKGENIRVDYLLNPTHLAGIGDIIKAIEQKVFDDETIDDYDLTEMIRDASAKVTTQKLLLVAHSQGNFYANSFYDTVAGIDAGLPTQSIAVYGVATPSGRVAGGGKWLTSDTDKVIAGVVGHLPARKIMEPNTHIALQADDGALGHNFSDIYLKYRGAEIVSDIESSLQKLRADEARSADALCIAPPELTLGHKIAGAAFAFADPLAHAVVIEAPQAVSRVGLAVANFFVGPTTQLAAVEAAKQIASGVAAVKDETKRSVEVQKVAEIQNKVAQLPVSVPPPAAAASLAPTAPPAPASNESGEAAVAPREEAPGTRLSPPGGGGGGVSNPAPAASAENQTSSASVSPTATQSADATPAVTSPPTGVVINEVAWSGTSASGAHEWIELFNPTSATVSLASTTLFAADLSPYISLSGTIAPNSYYLIESTDSAVSTVLADRVADFGNGLNNNGDALTFAFVSEGATTTIDATPTCSGGTSWCVGDATTHLTMERIDSSLSGADSGSWATSLGEFVMNGTDANGAAILGTPRLRNSVNYLIAPSGTLSASKTLTSANSPYLVPRSGLTVASGATLTLGAGAVVKIISPNAPSIVVNGAVVANGTSAAPVVFTSFLDDDYGGDTNADGSSTSPQAGNWRRILIESGSIGSSFAHTLIRYGGNNDLSDTTARKGALGVNGTSLSFTDSTIEYSNFHGLALVNSTSTVTNSVFRHNTNEATGSTGLVAEGGAPVISGNTFSDNRYGAVLTGAGGSFTDNTFSDNTAVSLSATQILGAISGNGGSGNAVQAILLSGTLTGASGTTTLGANSLPYLLKGQASIAAGGTLAFQNGVVVKGYDSRANQRGELVVQNGATLTSSGTAASDLIFTSLHDSSVGGTTEAGLAPAAAGDWYGITVNAGGRLALSGVTLRYAGARAESLGDPYAGLFVTGSAATSGGVSHALFEQNLGSGISLVSTFAFSLSDSVVQNQTLGQLRLPGGTGIYAQSSTASFSDLTFSGNSVDARGSGTNALTCANCGSPQTSPANLFSP